MRERERKRERVCVCERESVCVCERESECVCVGGVGGRLVAVEIQTATDESPFFILITILSHITAFTDSQK